MNFEIFYGSMKTTVTIIATIVLVKYYIYLIVAPFYTANKELLKFRLQRRIRNGSVPSEYNPLVSVIIPAWNEEVGILTTIKSVLASTYENIEIVVVNDGSKDRTDEVVRKFTSNFSKNNKSKKTITYVNSVVNVGKGSALNLGIKNSSGEIVMTMDADSAFQPIAIENLVKYFHSPEIDAVVGNVKVSNSVSVVGLLQKFEYLTGFYFKRVHSILGAEYIFGGACAAFRRSTTFDSIGDFNVQTKTEDIEYSLRTKLHGLKAVYAEDVIAYTEGASTLEGLYKQRLRWKKGRMDAFIMYRHLFYSRTNHHNKFLSWFVLPYAVLGEIQLLFEPMFFTLIWTYSFISGDYLSIGLSSALIFFTFLAALVFGDKETNRFYIFLFPSFWLLFYILVAVEFVALLKSIELLLAKEDIKWQNWKREGIKT